MECQSKLLKLREKFIYQNVITSLLYIEETDRLSKTKRELECEQQLLEERSKEDGRS